MDNIEHAASLDSLKSTLARIRHLRISGRLTYDKNAHPFSGGSYGDIRVGTYNHPVRGNLKVAVKCLRVFYSQSPGVMKLIEREVQVWSSLKHPNILPLLGYILEGNDFPTLVSEFMENGTALQYVVRHPEIDAVGIILGIANGVSYLHDKNIVHSDLKSDNVLISQQGTPLICDFGISRVIALTGSLSGYNIHRSSSGNVKGSARWMAPELLSPGENQTGKHTKESDIWAFSMTASELLAKRRPYHELKVDPQVVLAIVNGQLPQKPEEGSTWPENYQTAWQLCETCWSIDPESRPTLPEFISVLRGIHEVKDVNDKPIKIPPLPPMPLSSTLLPDMTSQPAHSKVDSFITPTSQPCATFRQMPLPDADLKSSTVEVPRRHIRGKYKGKEVLSFVITIHVTGKESWQVEKLYSDVLAFNKWLRAKCSRSTIEKLEPLPSSELLRDRSPATADQSKILLQAYLQSVMNLQLEISNEIIVFFSSGIVREHSPLPLTGFGYKEGYLMKRGRTFEGWKTRYFVLQGPVLNYFGSRGGPQLGAILITGAQLYRQTRTKNDRGSYDKHEYRHALLIIEQKRGPKNQNIRHILCAESDQERDTWVEYLVQCITGSYNGGEKMSGELDESDDKDIQDD